jgi:hypothetical protein
MFVFTPVQIHGGAFLYSLSGMTSRVAMRISSATLGWQHPRVIASVNLGRHLKTDVTQ